MANSIALKFRSIVAAAHRSELRLGLAMPDESAMPRQTSLEWIKSSDRSSYSSVRVHSRPLGGRVNRLEALAQKDAKLAEQTTREYLRFVQTEFAYFEEASKKLFPARDPPSLSDARQRNQYRNAGRTAWSFAKAWLPVCVARRSSCRFCKDLPGRAMESFLWAKSRLQLYPDPPEWVMKRFREIPRAAANQ